MGNRHENVFIQRCYNKYPDKWIIEAVEYVLPDDTLLKIAEQKYLDAHFGNALCMNLNPYSSRPPSPKGRPAWNKGTKGVMKAWNKGLPGNFRNKRHTEASRLKIREARKGQPAWNKG